jgi:hypothetical protein
VERGVTLVSSRTSANNYDALRKYSLHRFPVAQVRPSLAAPPLPRRNPPDALPSRRLSLRCALPRGAVWLPQTM